MQPKMAWVEQSRILHSQFVVAAQINLHEAPRCMPADGCAGVPNVFKRASAISGARMQLVASQNRGP